MLHSAIAQRRLADWNTAGGPGHNLSVGPMSADGLRLSAYVSGDPVNKVDPSGLAESRCSLSYVQGSGPAVPDGEGGFIVTADQVIKCIELPGGNFRPWNFYDWAAGWGWGR
jgi:hypothetical protein